MLFGLKNKSPKGVRMEEEKEIVHESQEEDIAKDEQKFPVNLRMRRVGAAVIDMIVIPIATIPIQLGLGFLIALLIGDLSDALRMIITLLVYMGLWTILSLRDLIGKGAGPGKMIFGLRVISTESGEKITWKQALHRNLLFILFCSPIVQWLIFLIELIFVLSKGKRLGDMMAKTEVINARRNNNETMV